MSSPRRAVQLLLLLVAVWGIGDSLYIRAKAVVAQVMLEDAWQQTVAGKLRVKPWSGADTWPVARLQAPRLGIDQIVLAGSSGRVLAFGPGRLSGIDSSGDSRNTVISGHRDTHFRWLQELQPGDELMLLRPYGNHLRYRVSSLSVHHQSDTGLLASNGRELLTLLTCYPFQAIDPGGPLRYVVMADKVEM